jgi:cell division protease FtsH
MVTEYGMSKTLGPLAFGRKEELIFLGREINEQRNYSDEIAFQIDKEIRELIDDAYALAKQVLIEQQDKLEAIAMLLMERETIEAHEMEELFDSPRPKPTLSGPQIYTPVEKPAERPDGRGQEAAPRLRPQPASG